MEKNIFRNFGKVEDIPFSYVMEIMMFLWKSYKMYCMLPFFLVCCISYLNADQEDDQKTPGRNTLHPSCCSLESPWMTEAVAGVSGMGSKAHWMRRVKVTLGNEGPQKDPMWSVFKEIEIERHFGWFGEDWDWLKEYYFIL